MCACVCDEERMWLADGWIKESERYKETTKHGHPIAFLPHSRRKAYAE